MEWCNTLVGRQHYCLFLHWYTRLTPADCWWLCASQYFISCIEWLSLVLSIQIVQFAPLSKSCNFPISPYESLSSNQIFFVSDRWTKLPSEREAISICKHDETGSKHHIPLHMSTPFFYEKALLISIRGTIRYSIIQIEGQQGSSQIVPQFSTTLLQIVLYSALWSKCRTKPFSMIHSSDSLDPYASTPSTNPKLFRVYSLNSQFSYQSLSLSNWSCLQSPFTMRLQSVNQLSRPASNDYDVYFSSFKSSPCTGW